MRVLSSSYIFNIDGFLTGIIVIMFSCRIPSIWKVQHSNYQNHLFTYTIHALNIWWSTPVSLFPLNDSKLYNHLTAHNRQKWKRVFLTCPCHEIYMDEAVGLKYTFKEYDFCEYVKFGAISLKFDILSIAASLKIES